MMIDHHHRPSFLLRSIIIFCNIPRSSAIIIYSFRVPYYRLRILYVCFVLFCLYPFLTTVGLQQTCVCDIQRRNKSPSASKQAGSNPSSGLSLLLVVTTGGGPGGGALLGDAAGGALAVGGVGGEVDVLLGGGPDVEGGDVDELVADADVALADEDAGVVDGLGEALLVDLGLEAALEELLGGELEDGVEVELVVGEEAVAGHAAEEGGTLEDALGVLGVEGEEGPGGLAELGQGVLDAPDLALAAEAVLADELELGVEALLLVGTTGRLEGLAVCGKDKK